MSEWVEIPAHRILLMSQEELHAEYDRIEADGRIFPWEQGDTYCLYQDVLLRRHTDGRVFKFARYHPPHAHGTHVALEVL